MRPLLTTALAPLAREWLAQNNLLAFPYRFGFTPSALGRLVTRLGFQVERVVGDVLVPSRSPTAGLRHVRGVAGSPTRT